jgi:hypothetical protein
VQIGWSFLFGALLVLFGCGEQPNARTGREAHGNALSEKEIRRVVVGHMGSLRSCYQSEVKRNPSLAGTVTAKWEIQPAGHVTKVRLADSTLRNEHVEECIVREVRRWRFPSSASGTSAEWPLRFGVAVDLDDGSR